MTSTLPTLLVLADGTENQLRMLEPFRERVRIVIGPTLQSVADAAPIADALLIWTASRDLVQQVFAQTPRLRWVHSRSAGLDSLLFPALVDSPVPLTNSSGVYSRSLGEFVALGVLFFAKDLHRMQRNQAAGRWAPYDVDMAEGKTMGIVGYGDIGRAAARLAKGLGMHVIALRRRPEQSQGDPLVDEVMGNDRLHELMARSDYVVVTAPLTPDTRGLVSAQAIAAMKPGAVMINVGRGAVIDEPALIDALRQRRIRGAALDVFAQEPLPDGHPMYGLDNLLLSPHCADHTLTWIDDAMVFFTDNLERFLRGEPLRNVVEKRLGY
ncbi:MAG: D-2-hydroxyacid dehydrogenase [Rhodoferax sp.]|jgi:phosphoglycerate dehydrogenase-like enzyme|nr:D-2-hydroxyacid dehydrogenase [Rhodoferax sp.]